MTDLRLAKLTTERYHALEVCAAEPERQRLAKATAMGLDFWLPITRHTLVRFLCLQCKHAFRARADVAIDGRHACPACG